MNEPTIDPTNSRGLNDQPGRDLAATPSGHTSPIAGERAPSVTIGRSADQIEAFLSDFSNFPRFMPDVAHAYQDPMDSSLWEIRFADESVERWQRPITSEGVGSQMEWRATEGGAFRKGGRFSVEPGRTDRGCIVRLKLEFDSTTAQTIAGFGKIMGKDADSQATVCLRRLKAYLECGEVPTIEGQSSGREESGERVQH